MTTLTGAGEMSDLNDIYQMLGRLQSSVDTAAQTSAETKTAVAALHRRIDETNKENSELRGAVNMTAERHERLKGLIDSEIKPAVDDYKKSKARGWGVITGIGLSSGGIGAILTKMFDRGG